MNFFDWLSAQFGTYERPSPSDIVPESSIGVVDSIVSIDFNHTNIPFTKPPRVYPKTEIPDSNSMDGYGDYGNNFMYIQAADEGNHQTMADFVADSWLGKRGVKGQKYADDCVYRVMQNESDDPKDFNKPHLFYAIHRVLKVGYDKEGRYFTFQGINNPGADPYRVRDKNILYLSGGVIN